MCPEAPPEPRRQQVFTAEGKDAARRGVFASPDLTQELSGVSD